MLTLQLRHKIARSSNSTCQFNNNNDNNNNNNGGYLVRLIYIIRALCAYKYIKNIPANTAISIKQLCVHTHTHARTHARMHTHARAKYISLSPPTSWVFGPCLSHLLCVSSFILLIYVQGGPKVGLHLVGVHFTFF